MSLYVINIMIFIAITAEGIEDSINGHIENGIEEESCDSTAELIVIFIYTCLTLVQPFILSFFLKQVIILIKEHKKKSLKWHLDLQHNVHVILNRIPDEIVKQIERSRSYEVWKSMPQLKIPFQDQWNLMKIFTSYHNSMNQSDRRNVYF